MKINTGVVSATAIIATLTLASQAWGACNTATEGEDDTGASNVFELSGQGNFSCADMNMYEITNANITLSNDGKSAAWTASEEADAVAVDPSSGNRCVYFYPDQAKSGQNLTPGNDKSISDVVVCSDGKPGYYDEPEVLPVTTAGVGCTGDIVVDGSSIFDGTSQAVVVAETLDGQTVAACSLTESGQEYCEDRCENFRDVGETLACTTSVNLLGEYNLAACQPCDTALNVIADGRTPPVNPVTGDPMEFCWEKVNSVYEGENDLVETRPDIEGTLRTPGTMLKHTPVRQSETSITWYNACYLTNVSVNGTDYWMTTCL